MNQNIISTSSAFQTSMNVLPRRGRATQGTSVSTHWAPTNARGTLSTAAEAITSTRTAHAARVRLENHHLKILSIPIAHLWCWHGCMHLPPSLSADIDECKGPDAACSGHGCINLVGSYRCECAAGYIFNSISRVCEGTQLIISLSVEAHMAKFKSALCHSDAGGWTQMQRPETDDTVKVLKLQITDDDAEVHNSNWLCRES